MADEIIEELWEIKDSIARDHEYDIRKLGAHLQNRRTPGRTYGIPGRIFKSEEELSQYLMEKRSRLSGDTPDRTR